MSHTADAFIKLYHRDLNRLARELEALPNKFIWEPIPGIINSCGILVQHLVGNLHYYIGAVLGNTGYQREREQEFSNTGLSKQELLDQIQELKQTIDEVLHSLDEEDLSANQPGIFPYESSFKEGLRHLYGHLNYHLGQVNYLRRIIVEKG